MKDFLKILAVTVAMLVVGVACGQVCLADGFASGDICNDITDQELLEAMGCDLGKKTVIPVAINIIQIVLGLVGIVAVAVIIYGGITYTSSLGDAVKVQKAKNAILYGVIGMLVALLSFAVVYFVSQSVWG